MAYDWTPERRNDARLLWLEGKSASQAAKVFGVTRNAMIGRWHRDGLRRYEKANGRARKAYLAAQVSRPPRPAWKPRPKPAPVYVDPPPVLAPIGPVDIVAAEDGACRFIAGDVRTGYQLCGHPGAPWCPAHLRVVYVKGIRPPRVGFVRTLPGRLLAGLAR